MKKLLALASIGLLLGCEPSDQFKALEAERDTLRRRLAELSDLDAIQKARAETIDLLRGIYNQSFDPLIDLKRVNKLLESSNDRHLLLAFKDDAVTVGRVLKTYKLALDSSTPQLSELAERVSDQKAAIAKKEEELSAATKEVDVASFTSVSLMLIRKFGQQAGFSYFEAADISNSRKVVALVPDSLELSAPKQLRAYVISLGDQPFQNTRWNGQSTFQSTEYLPVLRVANEVESFAVSGNQSSSSKSARDQLARLEKQLAQANATTRERIRIGMEQVSGELHRLVVTTLDLNSPSASIPAPPPAR